MSNSYKHLIPRPADLMHMPQGSQVLYPCGAIPVQALMKHISSHATYFKAKITQKEYLLVSHSPPTVSKAVHVTVLRQGRPLLPRGKGGGRPLGSKNKPKTPAAPIDGT